MPMPTPDLRRRRTSLAPRRARLAAAALLGALALAMPRVAVAQRDTTARRDTTTRRDTTVRRDTVPGRIVAPTAAARAPISARRAFLYSFLVPGLGQARLDRPNAGALFAGVELGAVLMARKASAELRYAKRVARDSAYLEGPTLDSLGSPVFSGSTARNRYASRIPSRRTQVEDWIAVMAFNHLFAGADAFVAAQLWDMPVRASMRATSRRGVALVTTMEFGRGGAR